MADDTTGAGDWLTALLEVDPLGHDRFRGGDPGNWPGGRVFGGLVAGQALWSATATVRDDHPVHSLHGYFLRPGAPGVPIDFRVDRIRDGRSFSTRLVTAEQGGEAIFGMAASFHAHEDGRDYQLPLAADAPGPDEGTGWDPGFTSRMRSLRHIELREVGPTPPAPDGTFRSTRRVWMRVADPLPDDPRVHTCTLAFLSDMGVVTAARPPSGSRSWASMMGASVDHSVWFHRPTRADEWLFYDLHAVSNSHSLGLVRGTLHTGDNTLVLSVAQEALIRERGASRWEPGPEQGVPQGADGSSGPG